MRVAQEVIFGPVVSVVPCDGLAEALEIGHGVIYCLSFSFNTPSINQPYKHGRDGKRGCFCVRAPPTGGKPPLPFGGRKRPGSGRPEASTAALDFYSEWKAVYVDYSDSLQRAQIDT